MRVAIVFDNFGPYHVARLAAAARLMDVLGVEVAGSSAEYDWEAPEIPRGLERTRLLDEAGKRSDWPLLAAAYNRRVGPWRPDVIALPGWSSTAALVGARWAAERGMPAVVMSETNASDGPRRPLTEFVKRRIITLFQAGLCGGTLARSYLAELGLPRDRIFLGYDVVDNEHFAAGAGAARRQTALITSVDGAQSGRYFLASARFVPTKNLPRLLEAFARYRQAAGPDAWPLVLLGDGPMRGELESARAAHGLATALVMPGFVQYAELPSYYGNAGAFVHASTTEQWGLVVNEAMACGLPVLVSERCGCAPDLVEEGRNGHTFDPHDADALAGLMLKIASGVGGRAAMGEASRQIIERWSPQTFAEGLERAVCAALDLPLPRPGLLERMVLWALSHR
jgi:glycosyltransferase involved in cell wall biosynthesis